MTTKKNKIIYYTTTGLFTALVMISIVMYLFSHEMASEAFSKLGFPVYIVYPLAIAKLLGLIAVWTGKYKILKEWAYAGYVFTFLLAISAHLNINDGEFMGAVMAIFLVLTSYVFSEKMI